MEYTYAVMRAAPKSCVKGLTMKKKDSAVDPAGCAAEHEFTMNVVKELGLNVYLIEADEAFPDCVFIEDPVFFLDGKAFFPQLGHPTRRGERVRVMEYVKENFPKLECIEMTGEGLMDGGDICFIGGAKKEILCGISQRTNEEGVRQLQAAFPDYIVTPIRIPTPENGGLLHLITMASRCGPDTQLAIGSSKAAQEVKRTIQEKAASEFEFFEVPDDWAANCIYVNGYVLHCAEEEYPESYKLFKARFGDKAIPLKNEEHDKIDGSLTCRVRLLNYN